MLHAENGDERLVIRLNVEAMAQDVVRKISCKPRWLWVLPFQFGHIVFLSYWDAYATGFHQSLPCCNRTAPSPNEEASAEILVLAWDYTGSALSWVSSALTSAKARNQWTLPGSYGSYKLHLHLHAWYQQHESISIRCSRCVRWIKLGVS